MKTHYPDPKWSEKDRNGHVHRYQGDQLPTLKVIIAGHRWCDECGESHDHNVYACIECGAAVEPRTTTTRPAPAKPGVTAKAAAQSLRKVAQLMPSYASLTPAATLQIHDIAIEAQRDDHEVSSFNSSGAVTRLAGPPPRYTLTINGGEYTIPLTEIEIRVASEAAKKGHRGMRDFADSILRDRGIIE